MFCFSIQILSETFLSIGKIKRDIIINMHRFSCKVLFILIRFLGNFEFSRQIFAKYSTVKFPENTFSGSRVVSYGRRGRRTDRQIQRWTDIKKLLVVFRNFGNAPNKDI